MLYFSDTSGMDFCFREYLLVLWISGWEYS